MNLPVVNTALTGIAASNLHRGITLDSFRGVHKDSKASLKKRIAGMRRRLGDAQTILIDEISMMGPEEFAEFEQDCRKVVEGKGHLPCGGLNIVLLGDFMQLPPVRKVPHPPTFLHFIQGFKKKKNAGHHHFLLQEKDIQDVGRDQH